MDVPKTREAIQALVDGEVQESLHLDYKASPALAKNRRDEIAKDVSAFANSDGGMIIYSVVEEGHLPKNLDQGVPNAEMDREWIENILDAHIAPKIPGLEIVQVPSDEDHSFYVIAVPKSYSGPHQAPSKHYFRRYNFSSRPMEHYEIQDIRNRQLTVTRLVSFDVEVRHTSIFVLVIANPGSHPAEDVQFEFSEPLAWREGEQPHALANGIRYLPPGRALRFWYHAAHEIFGDAHKGPRKFAVRVTYHHPELGGRHAEEFLFDFYDFLGSTGESAPMGEIDRHLKKIADALTKLAK